MLGECGAPAEILHLSLIQIGMDIQGSMLFVTARDHGKLDDNQIKVTGVTDGDTLMLTLSSGTVIQGHKKGNGILLDYPINGQLVPILFKPADTEYYSELVANWRDENKLEYARQEALKSSQGALAKTMTLIKETGLPAQTEQLARSFGQLEKAVESMRKVGKSIIDRTEVQLSCNEVFGSLKDTYFDSLHHPLYFGSFGDAVREYGNAANGIKERLKNGQISIERLPVEYQRWRDSFPLAKPAPARPSREDIDTIIADYKNKMNAASSALELTLQKAKNLRAEGEDIYKRASVRYERAGQTCK